MALTVFIDMTGFGLVLPLLPFWAERVGANAFGVGLIVAVYALAQFIFTPVLGALSDRYGRRPIILASLLIEATAFALTALAGTLPLLLVARFIGGLGASNIGSAQAVVADVTPPEQRARGMGMIGAAIGLGFVVGPALGGALGASGSALPFWVAMGVALVNAALVLRFLPETRRSRTTALTTDQAAAAEHRSGVALLFGGWQRAMRHPAVARLVAINFLFTLAFTAMETVFPLFTQQTFGWKAAQNGYLFTYVGVLIVLMQGGLIGRLVKRWGEQALLVGGLALLAIGLLALPFSQQVALLLVSLGLLSIGDGAVTPTSSALLSLASAAEAQGETLGFAQGLAGLGRMIGPLAAGLLFTLGGEGLPFLAGGLLCVLALLLALPKLASTGAAQNQQAQTEQQMPALEPLPLDTEAEDMVVSGHRK
jgi:multidrug resistance protein